MDWEQEPLKAEGHGWIKSEQKKWGQARRMRRLGTRMPERQKEDMAPKRPASHFANQPLTNGNMQVHLPDQGGQPILEPPSGGGLEVSGTDSHESGWLVPARYCAW